MIGYNSLTVKIREVEYTSTVTDSDVSVLYLLLFLNSEEVEALKSLDRNPKLVLTLAREREERRIEAIRSSIAETGISGEELDTAVDKAYQEAIGESIIYRLELNLDVLKGVVERVLAIFPSIPPSLIDINHTRSAPIYSVRLSRQEQVDLILSILGGVIVDAPSKPSAADTTPKTETPAEPSAAPQPEPAPKPVEAVVTPKAVEAVAVPNPESPFSMSTDLLATLTPEQRQLLGIPG